MEEKRGRVSGVCRYARERERGGEHRDTEINVTRNNDNISYGRKVAIARNESDICRYPH